MATTRETALYVIILINVLSPANKKVASLPTGTYPLKQARRRKPLSWTEAPRIPEIRIRSIFHSGESAMKLSDFLRPAGAGS